MHMITQIKEPDKLIAFIDLVEEVKEAWPRMPEEIKKWTRIRLAELHEEVCNEQN